MPKTSAFLRLHLVVFIFGFTAILGNLISLNALQLVFHRMWVAALAVFLFLLFTKRARFKWSKKTLWIILAGVVIAAHWITFFHSIKISNVSVTLTCVSTGAFFGSLLEPLVFKRKIRFREMVLGLMVVAGLALIFRVEGQYFWGIISALISAFLSAVFAIINSVLVKTNTPYRVTFLEMTGGFLAIGLFLLATEGWQPGLFVISTSDWLWLVILGTICTAYAFVESVNLMREVSPFSFLLAINMEPIYGILMAFVFFNDYEKLNPYFFLGALIILSTVFIDGWMRKKQESQTPSNIGPSI
jgi:drug/metabolite transporter (DMT)-like permease